MTDYTALIQQRGTRKLDDSIVNSKLYNLAQKISLPIAGALALGGLALWAYTPRDLDVNEEALRHFNAHAREIELDCQKAHYAQGNAKDDQINYAAKKKNELEGEVSRRGYTDGERESADSADGTTRLMTQRLENMWVDNKGSVKDNMAPFVYAQEKPLPAITLKIPSRKH